MKYLRRFRQSAGKAKFLSLLPVVCTVAVSWTPWNSLNHYCDKNCVFFLPFVNFFSWELGVKKKKKRWIKQTVSYHLKSYTSSFLSSGSRIHWMPKHGRCQGRELFTLLSLFVGLFKRKLELLGCARSSWIPFSSKLVRNLPGNNLLFENIDIKFWKV